VIAIPKTGTTTLTHRLKQDGFNIDKNIYKKIKKYGDKNYYHMTWNDIKKHKDISSYYVVCVIRNPYDRVYSAHLEYNRIYRKMSFDKYLDKMKNHAYEKHYTFIHGKPQYKFIYGIKNDLIKRPLKLYIMKQENLENDFTEFCKFFELKCHSKIIKNTSSSKVTKKYSYVKNMTQKQLSMIEDIYKIDFLIFNFKKYKKNKPCDK
jgi:hypothetical protein